MHPISMVKIIDRKRYNTDTAMLLAGNDYWDGHNYERSGRQTFLFRAPGGTYFAQNLTQWQGERNGIEPLTLEEAMGMYESGCSEHRAEYAEAFPGVTIQEA